MKGFSPFAQDSKRFDLAVKRGAKKNKPSKKASTAKKKK